MESDTSTGASGLARALPPYPAGSTHSHRVGLNRRYRAHCVTARIEPAHMRMSAQATTPVAVLRRRSSPFLPHTHARPPPVGNQPTGGAHSNGVYYQSHFLRGRLWTVQESNLRPPVCKTGALPIELTAQKRGATSYSENLTSILFSTLRESNPSPFGVLPIELHQPLRGQWRDSNPRLLLRSPD